VRSCLFTGIKRSRSQGLLAAYAAVSNKIRLESGSSRRRLPPRQPAPPHGHVRCAPYRICEKPTASYQLRDWSPGVRRRQEASESASSPAEDVGAPGSAPAWWLPLPARPRLGQASSRVACSGERTTWGTSASRPRPWDNVGDERLPPAALGQRGRRAPPARGPGTTRGTSASRPRAWDNAGDERLPAAGLGQRGGRAPPGRGPGTTRGTSARRGPAAADGVRDERPAGPRPWTVWGTSARRARGRGRCGGRAPGGGPRPCARAGPGTDAQHRPDVRGPSARRHKPNVKGPPARRAWACASRSGLQSSSRP